MNQNILDRIIETKRREVEAMKLRIAPELMAELSAKTAPSRLSMSHSIRNESGIIAEFKRRSPSKGDISPMADAAVTTYGYAEAGASAISVLTDTRFFGGSTADLISARAALRNIPLLRKDFIIDEYQIDEARVIGADAILLIAAVLPPDECIRLANYAHDRDLEVLLELHSHSEIQTHRMVNMDMAGINNRDLTSFKTDCNVSSRLAEQLPASIVKIAESGMKSINDVIHLRKAGFDGFLIGEAFMSTPQPAQTLTHFINGLQSTTTTPL